MDERSETQPLLLPLDEGREKKQQRLRDESEVPQLRYLPEGSVMLRPKLRDEREKPQPRLPERSEDSSMEENQPRKRQRTDESERLPQRLPESDEDFSEKDQSPRNPRSDKGEETLGKSLESSLMSLAIEAIFMMTIEVRFLKVD